MTKAEMQELIDDQRRQIEILTAKIEKLTALPDEAIRETPLYQELSRENRHLKENLRLQTSLCESVEATQASQKARLAVLQERYSRVLQDNQELAAAHDADYWIGITENRESRTSRLLYEYETLKEKCVKLTEKLDAADRYTRHLENQLTALLYELRPDEMPDLAPEEDIKRSRKVGRPKKATKTQIAEARRWRKAGYSVREIARMTEERWGANQAWSASYVQKLVKDVVVEKEAQKKSK